MAARQQTDDQGQGAAERELLDEQDEQVDGTTGRQKRRARSRSVRERRGRPRKRARRRPERPKDEPAAASEADSERPATPPASPRAGFAADFVRTAEVDAMLEAFAAGDHAEVGRRATELLERSDDRKERRAARALLRRVEPSRYQTALLWGPALLLAILAIYYLFIRQ